MIKPRIKNSVGIWGFSPMATRFMPAGYHQEAVAETMEDRTERAVSGLGVLVDGYEYHYPGEINQGNLPKVQKVLGKAHDIYAIAMGLHCIPEFGLGALTNPKKDQRDYAAKLIREAIDMCKEVGAKLIIWPGGEGYNYPFQISYNETWGYFIDGIQAAVEYANTKNVTVLHENSYERYRYDHVCD